ncbi:hypothetical protein AA106555_0890 [Neokomagataea thailandica NBRC 106555]|uniref:Uncharacterized protein n=1 Tax=Neokomagataea thailandica NBRC 106555 TaxID=1223520 RepID=A0ABQ0QPF7_9PROT|nr:hypothetical protein AA106555_0890 [Neokomagataea thailandica NBRC 106555]
MAKDRDPVPIWRICSRFSYDDVARKGAVFYDTDLLIVVTTNRLDKQGLEPILSAVVG